MALPCVFRGSFILLSCSRPCPSGLTRRPARWQEQQSPRRKNPPLRLFMAALQIYQWSTSAAAIPEFTVGFLRPTVAASLQLMSRQMARPHVHPKSLSVSPNQTTFLTPFIVSFFLLQMPFQAHLVRTAASGSFYSHRGFALLSNTQGIHRKQCMHVIQGFTVLI